MESWRKVWRDGLAPVLSTAGLKALRKGLAKDDAQLTQGSITTPPSLQSVLDWPCEGSCVIGYCGWQGDGLETVGEIEQFFAQTCFEIDRRLGVPAGCRWFLNWFDEAPRDEMRREMLDELGIALEEGTS